MHNCVITLGCMSFYNVYLNVSSVDPKREIINPHRKWSQSEWMLLLEKETTLRCGNGRRRRGSEQHSHFSMHRQRIMMEYQMSTTIMAWKVHCFRNILYIYTTRVYFIFNCIF